MKILQIHNKYQFKGGEDSVVDEEAKLLRHHGHEVQQLFRNNLEINSLSNKIKTFVNLPYSKESINILRRELSNSNKPDIAHVHNTFPLWTNSIFEILKEKKIPIVMTIHNYRLLWSRISLFDKEFKYYGYFKGSKFKTFLLSRWLDKNKHLLNNISKFILLTDFTKDKFENAGFKKDKLIIKPNFISKKKSIIKEISLKNDAIFLSRIAKDKGIYTLLKSWKNINIKLNVYGDGELLNKIKNRNKNKNCFFHGAVDRNKGIDELSKSKILIFPSEWYECMPMTILESFREGTLVLASNIGSIKSIIKNKYNGILFKPGDSNDLKEKIEWILRNPKICDTIARNALNDFNKKYTEEKNYQDLINLYNDVITIQN